MECSCGFNLLKQETKDSLRWGPHHGGGAIGVCQQPSSQMQISSFELLISPTQQQLTSEKKLPNRIGTKVQSSSSNRIQRMWQHKVHTWVIIINTAKKRPGLLVHLWPKNLLIQESFTLKNSLHLQQGPKIWYTQ